MFRITKITSFTLILNLFLVSSCGDDPKFKFPETVFAIEKIYDIGNANAVTDLRIHVSFNKEVNLDNIQEVRVVIVKSGKSFNAEDALSLTLGNYYVEPPSDNELQVIKLSSSTKDSDGSQIVNDIGYKLYVIAIGTDDAIAVSEFKEFTLKNRPIYAGDFVGNWHDIGPPGPADTKVSLRIRDDYTGQMFFSSNFTPWGRGEQDEIVDMNVNGTTITAFALNQLIIGYSGTIGPVGCAASGTLTGRFEDDINLVLNQFEWADCDGTRQVTLKFTKQ